MFKSYKKKVVQHHHSSFQKITRLKFLQSAIQVFELQDFADEEVTVAMGDLCVGDVNHVVVNVEIQLASWLELSFQPAAAFRPHNVVHLVLEAEQLR